MGQTSKTVQPRKFKKLEPILSDEERAEKSAALNAELDIALAIEAIWADHEPTLTELGINTTLPPGETAPPQTNPAPVDPLGGYFIDPD